MSDPFLFSATAWSFDAGASAKNRLNLKIQPITHPNLLILRFSGSGCHPGGTRHLGKYCPFWPFFFIVLNVDLFPDQLDSGPNSANCRCATEPLLCRTLSGILSTGNNYLNDFPPDTGPETPGRAAVPLTKSVFRIHFRVLLHPGILSVQNRSNNYSLGSYPMISSFQMRLGFVTHISYAVSLPNRSPST